MPAQVNMNTHGADGEAAALPGANPDATVPYKFGLEIARGGMGSILEAADCKLGRTVAVKIMLSEMEADEGQRQRFINEAAVLATLEHPNIVPIHDLGRDSEGQLYYTMKLVHGRTLQAILNGLRNGEAATLGHYTLDRLLTVFRKVCDALAFAHSRKIIHRDLKPENVMVGEFGEVLVMDWGLAKKLMVERLMVDSRSPNPSDLSTINSLRGSATQLSATPEDLDLSDQATLLAPTVPPDMLGVTMEGAVMGTPQYMSPEQAEGRIADMDARSDIFSLGGILYAILTLRPPVEGQTLDEVLQKVASGSITPPSKFGTLTGHAKGEVLEAQKIRPLPHCPNGRVPAALSAVAMKSLTVPQESRYQTVTAFSADVEAYQNGFATSAEKAGAWKIFTLFVKRHKAASIGFAAVLLVGAILGTKVFIEGQRAERTLGELRGTAPTFEAQSRALLSEGKLGDALEKIGYAVKLAPDSADYHLARAHLFQSTQKLAEATEAYRAVLALRPTDAAAKANLNLCGTLLTERGGAAELPLLLQNKLLDALVAQHRDLEAAPLAKTLKRDKETAEATIRARLASCTTQERWMNIRIQRSGKGFRVDLSQLQLGDLTALHGLPIVELYLTLTSVTDLRPLAELPLEQLSIGNTHVSDLSPLRDMKLRRLDMRETDVSDLTPLAGLPLKELHIGSNKNLRDLTPLAGLPLEHLFADHLPIVDISPLRGLPLREVRLESCPMIADFSPLAHSATLEKISLPYTITNIAFLATMPKLQEVEFHRGNDADVWVPAREFLAMYGSEVPELKAARAALASIGVRDLPIAKVAIDPDHCLRLDLNNTSVTDLSPLRGLRIKHLHLQNTGVRELEPLRGMPITDLNLHSVRVRDLEPLRGMPLHHLKLYDTKVSSLEPLRGLPLITLNFGGTLVRDVGLLADLHDLEEIVLPRDATNVERLRTLPKLRYLSTGWNEAIKHPAQTAEEFWKAYDEKTTGAGK